MATSMEFIFIQLPLLIVIGAAVTSVAWWRNEGAVSRRLGDRVSTPAKVLCITALAGIWMVLTVISWWWLLLPAYLTTVGMYALFGVIAGWAALVCYGVLFVSTPVVWGAVLFGLARREFRHVSPPASIRTWHGLKPV